MDRKQGTNKDWPNRIYIIEECDGNFGPAKILVRLDQNCRKGVKILVRVKQ